MNCDQAKELIDLRIQGGTDDRNWSEVEAHLASCPKCTAEYDELGHTRKLLSELATDGPTREEIETMWTGIASAGETVFQETTRRRLIWLFAAATLATAAVLFLAFQIGQEQYGKQVRLASASAHIYHLSTVSRVNEGDTSAHWLLDEHMGGDITEGNTD